MYLAKDNIYYVCQNVKIEKTDKNSGYRMYVAVLSFKNKMTESIREMIPQPEGTLAAGLLFGGSGELSERVKNNFSKTGMTHIVAVSGYNVAIIAEYLILLGIFLGLWRQKAFWFAIVGIFFFVAMIGFPSSAVRAGVKGSLLLWAMKNGRLANAWNAILFAGAIMLLINPLLLVWDIGFQLSFLATIGIVALSPFWERYFMRKYQFMGLMEIMLLSLSAQIFVLPIIAYNFHTFSVISLVANILILPIIPLTMLLVFSVSVFGLFLKPLALVFAWLAFLPLKYEVLVINFLGELSWSSRVVEKVGWQFFMLWYGVLALVSYWVNKKIKNDLL